MPRPKKEPTQKIASRKRHFLSVLHCNGGWHVLNFFSSEAEKKKALNEWLKTGRFFQEGSDVYSRPYCLISDGTFFFNLEQSNETINQPKGSAVQ